MKFKVLQDNLRKTLWSRIEEGDLTGLRLAKETGFKQAHISNFLNRKRGLSIAEIPVRWRNDAATRVSAWRGAAAFADLFRIRANDARGFYSL